MDLAIGVGDRDQPGEIRYVVGDEGLPFSQREAPDGLVVPGPKMALDHRQNLIPAGPQRDRDRRRDVLVQEQPHSDPTPPSGP